MLSFVSYFFRRFLQLSVAPFLLFWGNIPLISDVCSTIANASMTQAFFFFAIFFVFTSFCFKNSWLSVFTRKLFKNSKFNRSSLLNSVNSSFALFKSSFLVFLKFIKNLRS
uniref:Uncharacterized protein n=1 Tax=Oxytricha trifallax TaxID=1172189 RepID=G9HRC5_9SPIT|nr:hypothetical protein [Oxytricha trifallax]